VLRALLFWLATIAAGQMPMRGSPAFLRTSAVHEVSDSATDAVRHIYAAVQASIRSGALRRVDTTFQCDSESLEYEAHWYADSTGMIRRLDLGVGTGDHAEQLAFYYDSKQRLRFAYAQRGAVVGTQQEERIYYDGRRTQLARRVRWVHGPHYPFAPLEPVWDPTAWRKAACD
jgi:hypothetical protein